MNTSNSKNGSKKISKDSSIIGLQSVIGSSNSLTLRNRSLNKANAPININNVKKLKSKRQNSENNENNKRKKVEQEEEEDEIVNNEENGVENEEAKKAEVNLLPTSNHNNNKKQSLDNSPNSKKIDLNLIIEKLASKSPDVKITVNKEEINVQAVNNIELTVTPVENNEIKSTLLETKSSPERANKNFIIIDDDDDDKSSTTDTTYESSKQPEFTSNSETEENNTIDSKSTNAQIVVQNDDSKINDTIVDEVDNDVFVLEDESDMPQQSNKQTLSSSSSFNSFVNRKRNSSQIYTPNNGFLNNEFQSFSQPSFRTQPIVQTFASPTLISNHAFIVPTNQQQQQQQNFSHYYNPVSPHANPQNRLYYNGPPSVVRSTSLASASNIITSNNNNNNNRSQQIYMASQTSPTSGPNSAFKLYNNFNNDLV